jgi:hypothetical protein
MLCYVMLCCAMLCCAVLCYVMLCYVMLCYAILWYAMFCYVMLCYVVLCYVILCYTMLCYVMLYYAMLCYAMLRYAMLCCVKLCYVMLCCSHCSYSYIEYINQQMHSVHTMKYKYPGAETCSSFVLVMKWIWWFYFMCWAHLWLDVLKCIGRVLGVWYSGSAVGWGTALQAGRSRVVIEISCWHDPSGRTMALGLTQPLTEMSTRCISWGVKASGGSGWQSYHLHVPIALKSRRLKLLEPSGPVQGCNGIALHFNSGDESGP